MTQGNHIPTGSGTVPGSLKYFVTSQKALAAHNPNPMAACNATRLLLGLPEILTRLTACKPLASARQMFIPTALRVSHEGA